MAIPPIKIDVYDKDFAWRGRIGAPKFATCTLRHNVPGTTTIGVLGSDRMIPVLFEPGARLLIRDENSEHLMSGWVERRRAKGPARSSLFEFDIDDDFKMLQEVLGWVQPASAITAQGTGSDYWRSSGPAETVLKAAVTANAITRLGMPVTCATDLGRGSTISASLRFHPLFDRIFPVVDGAGLEAAGIGVTVRQVGTGLVVDVYETTAYPRPLTEESGVITDWSFSDTTPTATRVAVGGPGEAQLRSFRTVTDSARETAYARVIERFRDARDVAEDDPDMVPKLYSRGQQTLDEGAPKAGLSVTMSQTKNFRYGTVKVGDRVTLSVAPDVSVTDTLKEAVLSWTDDAGWKVTPKAGDFPESSDFIIAKAVRSIARRLANLTRT